MLDPELYQLDFFTPEKKWMLEAKGLVINTQGAIVESGGMFTYKNETAYISEASDKSYYRVFAPSFNDINIEWESTKYLSTGEALQENYKSSKKIIDILVDLILPTSQDWVKVPASADYWIARRVEENQEEYFFNVESKEQFRSVCSEYGFEVNNILGTYLDMIDKDRMSARFRSYPLSSGEVISIIPAGVVIENGEVVDIRLYLTIREEDFGSLPGNEEHYAEKYIDNEGVTRTLVKSSKDEYSLNLLKERVPEFDVYSALLSGKAYNSIFGAEVYTYFLSELPEELPEKYVAMEFKYVPETGELFRKVATAYNSNVPLPDGSVGVFTATYVDESYEQILDLEDVYFTNSNGVDVCSELGITISEETGIPTHFGITYDKTTGKRIRSKAYFYPKYGKMIW